jgi:hypothetical protein
MKITKNEIERGLWVFSEELFRREKSILIAKYGEKFDYDDFMKLCVENFIKISEFNRKEYICVREFESWKNKQDAKIGIGVNNDKSTDKAETKSTPTVSKIEIVDEQTIPTITLNYNIAIDTLKKATDAIKNEKTNGNGYDEALIEQTRTDLLNEAKKAYAKEQWIKLDETQKMLKVFEQKLETIKSDKISKLEAIKEKTLDEALKDRDKAEDQISEIVQYKIGSEVLDYLTADTETRILKLAEYEANLKAQASMFYKPTKFVTVDEIRKEVKKEAAFDEVKEIFKTNEKLIAEIEKGE